MDSHSVVADDGQEPAHDDVAVPNGAPAEPRAGLLFALFIAAGLVAFVYVWMTLHRNHSEELSTAFVPTRAHAEITHWIQHGYFASYGLLVPVPNEKTIYRSETGGFMITGFLAEKIWTLITGKYGWRLLALHNVLITLIISALLALLAYRIARRLGVDPLRAIVLAIAAQMVQFTFPENLMSYWDLPAITWWLMPAIGFLLIEERALDGRRTRFLTILQALMVFAMTYLEYICGTMFVVSYAATLFVLRGERPSIKRLVAVLTLPWAAAMAIYGLQLVGARHEHARTGVKVYGSGFLYRTGLDGDSMLYGDHLDIAFGRDIVRAGGPPLNAKYFFRWEWLFFAGVASVMASLAAFIRGRTPRIVIVVLVALIGTYLLYAAVFSQAVALHPYHFDVLLATPLILALFGIAPALLERQTRQTGMIVLLALFGAAWLSMFQLRIYALCYPNNAAIGTTSHR